MSQIEEEQACETPLVDLLREIPKYHRTEWETQWFEDGTPSGHAMCPIGRDAHRAADTIESLEKELSVEKIFNNGSHKLIEDLTTDFGAFIEFVECCDLSNDDPEVVGTYLAFAKQAVAKHTS